MEQEEEKIEIDQTVECDNKDDVPDPVYMTMGMMKELVKDDALTSLICLYCLTPAKCAKIIRGPFDDSRVACSRCFLEKMVPLTPDVDVMHEKEFGSDVKDSRLMYMNIGRGWIRIVLAYPLGSTKIIGGGLPESPVSRAVISYLKAKEENEPTDSARDEVNMRRGIDLELDKGYETVYDDCSMRNALYINVEEYDRFSNDSFCCLLCMAELQDVNSLIVYVNETSRVVCQGCLMPTVVIGGSTFKDIRKKYATTWLEDGRVNYKIKRDGSARVEIISHSWIDEVVEYEHTHPVTALLMKMPARTKDGVYWSIPGNDDKPGLVCSKRRNRFSSPYLRDSASDQSDADYFSYEFPDGRHSESYVHDGYDSDGNPI